MINFLVTLKITAISSLITYSDFQLWLWCAGGGGEGGSGGSAWSVGTDVRWDRASGCGCCPGIRLVCGRGQGVEWCDRCSRALWEIIVTQNL